MDFAHGGGKRVYTWACVFKLPESFRNCYSFKRHSHIDVRGGDKHQEAWKDHIVCAVGRLGRKAWLSKARNVGGRQTSVRVWLTPITLTET